MASIGNSCICGGHSKGGHGLQTVPVGKMVDCGGLFKTGSSVAILGCVSAFVIGGTNPVPAFIWHGTGYCDDSAVLGHRLYTVTHLLLKSLTKRSISVIIIS